MQPTSWVNRLKDQGGSRQYNTPESHRMSERTLWFAVIDLATGGRINKGKDVSANDPKNLRVEPR